MEDARVWVVFGAVRNLAVPVLLRASFIDKSPNGIFPPGHVIMLYHFAPESVIGEVVRMGSKHDKEEKEGNKSRETTLLENKATDLFA